MDDLLQRVRRCEALQQPEWGDPSRLRDVQAYLRGSPALIRAGDILALRATLARVARGEALVVQCGDCAEDMDDHHAENVARKAAVLELLDAPQPASTSAAVRHSAASARPLFFIRFMGYPPSSVRIFPPDLCFFRRKRRQKVPSPVEKTEVFSWARRFSPNLFPPGIAFFRGRR